MKKIWLIAFFIFTVFHLDAENLTHLDRLSVKLYFQDSWNGEKGFSSPLIGERFSSGFFEETFYLQQNSFTYGISFTSDKFNEVFPVTLKAGKLSASGSLSKLNSPILSASLTPFFNASTSISEISAMLPSSTGFSKPNSIFFQQEYRNPSKETMFSQGKINFLTIAPKEEFSDLTLYSYVSSAIIRFQKSKKSKFQFSLTSGLFPFEENIASSWYLPNYKSQYFPKTNIFCQNFQTGFQNQIFNNTCIVSQYQQPSGDFSYCFRSENKFSLNKTSISFSVFYSPKEFFSSSQKIISDQLQFKTGIQYNFILPLELQNQLTPLFIKTGIAFYCDEDFQKNFNLKIAPGINYSIRNVKGNLSAIFSGDIKPNSSEILNLNSLSLTSTTSFALIKIKPKLIFNYSMTKSTKEIWTYTEKISFSSNFLKNPALNFTNSLAFSEKDKEITKKQLTASLSGNYQIKDISLAMKFSVDCEF